MKKSVRVQVAEKRGAMEEKIKNVLAGLFMFGMMILCGVVDRL